MSLGKSGMRGSKSIRMDSLLYISFFVLVINQLSNDPLVDAGKDKGDDIILSKGKIILRGGKGKGNIILDPGHSSDGGHHEMSSMMPMMGHFNPYAFYPMQHHQQPQVMVRPIYIEDHSAMHHMPEQHHHQQHEYHHEEPQQHHYEPEHQDHHEHHEHQEQHHVVEQPHYESHEHHPQEGGEEHHHEGYEHHHGHPMMSLMAMHGSGPQPIYQQQQQQQQQQQHQQHMAAMQAFQQPGMYAQLSPEQQAAYQQAQYMAAEQEAALQHQQHQQQQQQQQQLQQHQQQQSQEMHQGQSSEIASHSPGDTSASSSGDSASVASAPSKPTSKVTALFEKTTKPIIERIKPLFKRNKDQQKDSSQKKP